MVSKDIMENIDLEEGKIRIKGEWFTEDEIRYAIRMKVESDDYNVADLAVALKTLISEMNKSTILKVRVPKELADGFEEISKKRQETVESLLRTLLIEFITREKRRDSQSEPGRTREPEGEKMEAEIVDVMDEGEEGGVEEEKEGIHVVYDEDVESEILDLESSTLDSETQRMKKREGSYNDELEEMDDFDNELEEEIKDFPSPENDIRKGRKILRRKRVRPRQQ